MSMPRVYFCAFRRGRCCVVQVAPRANKISLLFACDRVEPSPSCLYLWKGVEPWVREMIASWIMESS